MRVDRRSRIHRILGLVLLSWSVAPVLRWLPAAPMRLGSRVPRIRLCRFGHTPLSRGAAVGYRGWACLQVCRLRGQACSKFPGNRTAVSPVSRQPVGTPGAPRIRLCRSTPDPGFQKIARQYRHSPPARWYPRAQRIRLRRSASAAPGGARQRMGGPYIVLNCARFLTRHVTVMWRIART